MSAALRRSRLRDRFERAVVWFAGFAATGYVFHDVDAAQLRDLGPREIARVVGSIAVVVLGVGYFALVVPRTYAAIIVFAAVYLAALRVLMLVVQWTGVRIIEARQ